MRKIVKELDAPGRGFKPNRYEVMYQVQGKPYWVLQSTNATYLGAWIEYHAVPLGAIRKRIVDNGKNWKDRHARAV